VKYLLDTNTCVDCLRKKGNPLVQTRLGTHPPSDIALCSIVVAELRFGAEKSANPAKHHAQVDTFVSQFVSLSFDDVAARNYGQIRHTLESLGQAIGDNDTLIAAIAVANNLILVTHNTREFSRVAGLVLEDWQIP
jgi:tRNA(fMet)-specific endonuclease VapC